MSSSSLLILYRHLLWDSDPAELFYNETGSARALNGRAPLRGSALVRLVDLIERTFFPVHEDYLINILLHINEESFMSEVLKRHRPSDVYSLKLYRDELPLPILRWIWESPLGLQFIAGAPLSKFLRLNSVSSVNLDRLQFLLQCGIQLDPKSWRLAADLGSLSFLLWLKAKGCPRPPLLLPTGIPNSAIVRWFMQEGFQISPFFWDCAFKEADLELIKDLRHRDGYGSGPALIWNSFWNSIQSPSRKPPLHIRETVENYFRIGQYLLTDLGSLPTWDLTPFRPPLPPLCLDPFVFQLQTLVALVKANPGHPELMRLFEPLEPVVNLFLTAPV